MKKKLIDAIKAKFVGIDENTAKRLAERAIAKSENGISSDDEVTVAVEAITLADVLKSVNDFSADDAIKKYEEKYGLEKGEKKNPVEPKPNEPKPNEPKPNEPKPSEPKPEDAFKEMLAEFKKSMADEFKTVKEELNAMKSGKISETRRAKLDAALKDLKDFQKKPYGRIDLSKMSNDEFDTFMTEVKEEVGDMIADNRASESHVSPLFGGGNRQNNSDNGKVKEASKEEIDALVGKFGLQEQKS